ncbi:hypothetical protein P7C71_g761, partial [Lecanoromycetidae sp. Uapishka_2]
MPPKKKAPRPPRPASIPSEDAGEAREAVSMLPKADDAEDRVNTDTWTDEQEIVLFKSMIQCKPVDQGTEDDQKDEEEDADAMDVDEDDNKASTLKNTSNASKVIGKGSMRRSGRKR